VRVGEDGGAATGLARPLLRVQHDALVRLEADRRDDPDVHPGGGAAEQQRVRHVVGAVAEVDEGEPGEPALALADRHEVGEHLARVELVGERVDDRDRRGRRHRLEALLREGAPHDPVDVTRQDPRSVLDGLFAAELHRAAVDDHRVPAELADADLEREPGPRRVLFEDRRDGLAGQRLVAERVGLERVGEVEDGLLLGRADVVVAEEVAQHQSESFVVESSASGSAARKPSAWSPSRTSGGASRTVSGATGLTR
jgi:hypothetical protein